MNSNYGDRPNPLLVIRDHYNTLTNTQKKIADLLLKHGDSVCFMSLKEFSKEAGVTAVTIIRFCKQLGYENYSSFKKDLQYYMKSFIAPNNVIQTFDDMTNQADSVVLFNKIIKSEHQLVQRVYETLNLERVLEAVDLIKGSSKIYVVASGVALSVAQFMYSRLFYLKTNTELMDYTWKFVTPSHFSLVEPSDVFVVFSFPNYSPSLVDVVKCAKALGQKVICITDKPISPIANYADLVLLCDTQGAVFVNSMTPVMTLVTVMLSMLAAENQEKIAENAKRLSVLHEHIETR